MVRIILVGLIKGWYGDPMLLPWQLLSVFFAKILQIRSWLLHIILTWEIPRYQFKLQESPWQKEYRIDWLNQVFGNSSNIYVAITKIKYRIDWLDQLYGNSNIYAQITHVSREVSDLLYIVLIPCQYDYKINKPYPTHLQFLESNLSIILTEKPMRMTTWSPQNRIHSSKQQRFHYSSPN
jgi:hypothetical protein